MIALDEDALICDLAETYRIYDYRSLPARRAATFAAGLREDSRIMLKLNGMSCAPNLLLLAGILDRLSLLWWSKTTDAEKNRNRPESVLCRMLGHEERKPRTRTFASGDDFEAQRNAILSRVERGES